MRLRFQLLKKLRAYSLQGYWQYFGNLALEKTCHETAPQLVIEDAVEQSFPKRTMLGRIKEVPQAVAEMFQAGLISTEDRDNWDGQSSILHPPSGLSFIDGGSVVGKRGILLSPKNGVLEDLGGGPLAALLGGDLKPTHVPKPKKLGGDLFVMTRGIAQRNYFHWTFEMLAQLRLLHSSGVCFDYVAVPNRHRFARDSLEVFGVRREQIILLNPYTHIQADRLIVPSKTGRFPHPSGVVYLRDTMRGQTWSQTKDVKRARLYISRGRTTLRRLTNEPALVAALRPHGFQTVRLEKYSVREQIKLFQRAEFIVGPHGAGFSNIAYCQPGTRVVEISATSRPRPYFYYLAATNQLQYAIYFASPTSHPNDNSDITVDVEDLLQNITAMLDEN